MTAAKKDILQGWKDIAAYVSRDVRTVKRWEKQRGLPVRRMPGIGRANVYALIPELDRWLSADTDLSEAAPVPPEIPEDAPIELAAEQAPPPVALIPHARPGRAWILAVIGLVLIGAITAFAFGLRAHRRSLAAATVPPNLSRAGHTVKYSSKQPGVDALYLRGIYFYEQRTPEGLNRALQCFQDAIAKDPSYAPAYSGLAQTYNLLREYSTMPDAQAYESAKTAARHAIAIDPDLPEPHAALAFAEFFWDWDAAGAEREFQTSIALDPNSALVHHWYGSMLTHEGRFQESLVQLDLAQRLQPTSTSIISDHAFALGLSGHREQAIEMLQSVISQDAKSPAPHYILAGLSMSEPRNIGRFLSEMRLFATLRHDPDTLRSLDELDRAFRSGGEPAFWRVSLQQEERNHPNKRTVGMVNAETVLGRKEDAIRDLAQLAADHDPGMIGIAINNIINPLHDDPRYKAIIEKVGIPHPGDR